MSTCDPCLRRALLVAMLAGRIAGLLDRPTTRVAGLLALPEPELNVKLHDAAGFIGRVDMLFPDWRVIVEYEGRQHADSLHQWNKDLWRYERLERAGYVVIRVTQEMLRRPRELICRIHAILVERGFGGSAPTFGPLWRSLFA